MRMRMGDCGDEKGCGEMRMGIGDYGRGDESEEGCGCECVCEYMIIDVVVDEHVNMERWQCIVRV